MTFPINNGRNDPPPFVSQMPLLSAQTKEAILVVLSSVFPSFSSQFLPPSPPLRSLIQGHNRSTEILESPALTLGCHPHAPDIPGRTASQRQCSYNAISLTSGHLLPPGYFPWPRTVPASSPGHAAHHGHVGWSPVSRTQGAWTKLALPLHGCVAWGE